jgi:phosphinothricin acetyltransferase
MTTPTPSIRDATLLDADTIAAIYNHYIATSTATFEVDQIGGDEEATRMRGVVDGGYPYLVAEVDGQVVGYAYAAQYRPRAAYAHTVETSVYVATDTVSCGVGTALYTALFDRLQSFPLHVALAVIALPNPGSVALHERFGFTQVGQLPEVGRKFDRWIDVGFWHRPLG